MSVRSLNKVLLIGNLTRDPNLRFTPNNTAVCSFGIATNRTWAPSDGGEKQERAEFHNIVAWSKLAEICGQLLGKGDKVYVEGRMQTREWKGDNNESRRTTEVVIDNMILLQSRSGKATGEEDMGMDGGYAGAMDDSYAAPAASSSTSARGKKKAKSDDDDQADQTASMDADDVADDVPF